MNTLYQITVNKKATNQTFSNRIKLIDKVLELKKERTSDDINFLIIKL